MAIVNSEIMHHQIQHNPQSYTSYILQTFEKKVKRQISLVYIK